MLGKIEYFKIKQAIFVCLIIGIPATIIFELFPDVLLKFLFNTNQGINYIKVIAPICLLHYIQSPISSSLQAMESAKISMIGTLIGMILRTISLFIFSLPLIFILNTPFILPCVFIQPAVQEFCTRQSIQAHRNI